MASPQVFGDQTNCREAGSGADRMNWKRVPPESGAVVMSIGVVSVASELAGFPVLSVVLLMVAAALWGVLAVAFLARISFDTKRRPTAPAR